MREKCDKCGDRIFKIIDGVIKCRKGHIKGTYIENEVVGSPGE